MTFVGDWDNIIDDAEAECFVGREHELITFQQHIHLTPPRYLVFYITGQGGAGKTTLLNRYREIAREAGFLLVYCDEQQRNVPAVLGRFAHQLTEQGFSFKHFDGYYKVYRQKMHEIENDPDAPQGIAALIGRTVVRAAFVGGDLLPGVRQGLEYISSESRESIETQSSEWVSYLSKRFKDKDDVELIREPISALTPLFFKDLNEIAKKQRVLLCFDNFEATRQELQEWILGLRDYKPSQNVRITIASRDKPGAKWDVLRKVTLTVHLDIFSEREAEAFLDAYGIIDTNRRREILEYSGRLPVLMSWLSAPEGQASNSVVSAHDIVERFLRWVSEPPLRQAALLAAIPRTFNVDIVKYLFNSEIQNIDVLPIFDWLLTMPFVQHRLDGWQYHSVVRRLMLRYQRQKSPHDYRNLHANLAKLYKSKSQEISSSTEDEWTNEEWRTSMLVYAYHFLVSDPVQHWNEIMSLFVVALRESRAFAIEIIELLNLDDLRDELSHEQLELVQFFKQGLESIENGDLKDGMEMFDKLCAISGLSSSAKCCAFAYHGESYRLAKNWQKALDNFEKSLIYNPEDAWTVASRGQTYQAMKRYEEALTDFDRAIALDEKDDWYRYLQALVYLVLDRRSDFESTLHGAIELAQTILRNTPNDWQANFNLVLYKLVAEYMDARELYNQLVSTCSSVSALQEAIDDLNNFLKVQNYHETAKQVSKQLRERINELQNSFAK